MSSTTPLGANNRGPVSSGTNPTNLSACVKTAQSGLQAAFGTTLRPEQVPPNDPAVQALQLKAN